MVNEEIEEIGEIEPSRLEQFIKGEFDQFSPKELAECLKTVYKKSDEDYNPERINDLRVTIRKYLHNVPLEYELEFLQNLGQEFYFMDFFY